MGSHPADTGLLDSWKQIASFLGRSVRTVQRWERIEGLPVRRHHHLKRGSVYAFPSQLQSWQRQRGLGPDFSKAPLALPAIPPPSVLVELKRLQDLTRKQVILAQKMRDLIGVHTRLEDYYEKVGFLASPEEGQDS